MTEKEQVYVQTLNLLGSDFEPDEIQAALDAEHAAADPQWWADKVREKERNACSA